MLKSLTEIVLCLLMSGAALAEVASVRMDQLETIDYEPTTQADDFTGDLEVPKMNPLPEWFAKLNGKPISIHGFMYPLDFEDGLTREFLYLPFDLTCHFGDFPQIDEFLHVFVEGDGYRPELHLPSKLTGILEIKETWEGGIPVGLLYLKATSVDYTGW
ncbi:MAG: DUF3299 domain-containing protein [Opitutales bacterium]